MPSKIVVVSSKPIAADDLGPEIEVEPEMIVNIGLEVQRLPQRATGLLIHGPSDQPFHLDIETLVAEALNVNIPVLASGSGMCLLNAAMCGDDARPTPQHIDGVKGDMVRNSVFLAPGAKVSSTIGGSGWLTIPCRHGSGLVQAGLAPGLMISAISDDRVVEAYEMPGRHWVIGAQWDVLGAIKMPRGFDGILMSFVERATGK